MDKQPTLVSRILEYIQDHPWQSATEISHGMEHQTSSVAATLSKMRQRGLITCHSEFRGKTVVRLVKIYAPLGTPPLAPQTVEGTTNG